MSRRWLDVGLSLAALPVVAPIIAAAFLVARLQTGQSGIFVQERIGRGGHTFGLIKIRTMKAVSRNDSMVTTASDTRVTHLGRILRRFKIDEFPQVINVLRGDMAIVGPRPTVREDYERMDERQRGRFAVRPGMTGLAQIRGNTALGWPRRIELDLLYIEKQRLLVDLRIIGETAWMILTNRIES
ncbi:MAG: sugar transferase, partial [Acidobacteriota bacterium]